MLNDILTPMNHREIEYHAKKLSGCEIPDSFACTGMNELLKWLDETGTRVFDDDLVMDYGTDCLRLYLLFEQTPRENDAPYYDSWKEGALEGIYKFLGRARRMILTANLWNRSGHYNEETVPDQRVQRLEAALAATDAQIRKCILRGNTMPNRHHIVAALMELLNLFQKELKTGDIISALHNQAVAAAVPHSRAEYETPQEADSQFNPNVAECCRRFLILLAPYAPDLCKMLWVRIKLV